MSVKNDFNDDQWFLLGSMPGMVGAAMSNAAPSGVIGTIKEMSAAMRASIQGKKDFPDSDLINELMQKAANWEEAKEQMSDYRERAKARVESADIKSRDALQMIALQDCKAAVELVDAHCSDADAQAYRQWTLNVARAVAEAAKEGSILGFGGERVSEPERKLLAELEQVLGLSSGVLTA